MDYFKDSISRRPRVSIFLGTLGQQMDSLTGQIPIMCCRHQHYCIFHTGVGSIFQVNKHHPMHRCLFPPFKFCQRFCKGRALGTFANLSKSPSSPLKLILL
uniref:Uncharacterized protein n=1 Tax=Micrurus lemniscatus lemniscatus TaxID=129467 RepID=A0A2D4IRL1_MICLE